ncbi:DUF4382 domain-containing protein [Kaarinaea lacus]
MKNRSYLPRGFSYKTSGTKFMPLISLLFLIISVVLGGCQSGDNASDTQDNGEIIIGLTDAKGDFLNYTVDVKSLTLTKANGAVVETLPLSTSVDFSQYTEMTEFLTAATIPAGRYVKATLKLDYQNAEIWVEDANGAGTQVTDIVDTDGNAVSELEVSVRLEGRNSLYISRGVPAHITLDFDLNASNQVTFNPNEVPTVTVEPFLLADLVLDKPKIHRLRGPLARVDVENNRFNVIIRPFHHPHVNDRRFGTLDVHVSANTVYDIDDMDYVGEDGLAALDALPTFSATVVVGDLKFNPRRFVAREVYAGSSVAGGTQDVVRGTVISRQDNVLNVKGATLIRSGGSVVFNDVVTVTVADTTLVKRQLSSDQFSITDISVGQRVAIFGTLISETANNLQMNASNGVVRMKLTTLNGTTVEAPATSSMIVDLHAINARQVDIYDFSGTGIDVDNDADPTNYEIATGALDLSAVGTNTPVVVGGFVQPFGQAPEDFDAQTVVDLSSLPAIVAINWQPGSSTPFLSSSFESVILNLDGTGLFHHVSRGRVSIDLNDFADAPTVAARPEGEGVFVIELTAGPRILFTDFAAYIDEIENRLTNGATMLRFGAAGSFSDNNATLNNTRMIVVKLM